MARARRAPYLPAAPLNATVPVGHHAPQGAEARAQAELSQPEHQVVVPPPQREAKLDLEAAAARRAHAAHDGLSRSRAAGRRRSSILWHVLEQDA